MTPFRKNLEQLRDDHYRQRYSGDLAADVLGDLSPGVPTNGDPERSDLLAPMRIDGSDAGGARTPWRTMFLPLAATAAIAATIAVGVTLAITHATTSNSDRSTVAVVTPTSSSNTSTNTDIVARNAPPVAVATNHSTETHKIVLPTEKGNDAVAGQAVAGQAVANQAVAAATPVSGNSVDYASSSTSGNTEVASTESEEFTLVPAVASLVGDNASLDFSSQGMSFDFDLSNLSSDSSSTPTATPTTPAAYPTHSSRSSSEERL